MGGKFERALHTPTRFLLKSLRSLNLLDDSPRAVQLARDLLDESEYSHSGLR